MALVKIKDKFQITLPSNVRSKSGLKVGDLLEATSSGNKITLTPKTVVDRDIAISRSEWKRGKAKGPFKSAGSLVRSLKK